MLTPQIVNPMLLQDNEEARRRAVPPVDDGLDRVAALHTSIVDALAGYETMAEKAEPEFRPVVDRFISLHRSHGTATARILTDHGREPDNDGSFMGTVNKAVVSIRAMFTDIDSDTLDRIHSGEEHILNDFDDAIREPLSENVRADLVTMRAELADLLRATRDESRPGL